MTRCIAINNEPPARSLQALLGSLLTAALFLFAAVPAAQGAPPYDPPARVGKISLIAGAVTQTDIATGERQEATLNWPLTSGQRLATARASRAEVRIGSMSVRIDGDSEVDFARIDDDLIQIVVQRGTAAVRVRNREMLREIDLLTPRERIVLDDVGRYRVDVDQVAGLTSVTVHLGQARVASAHMTFTILSGQRGEIRASPAAGFILVAPYADQFDDWVAQRDRRDDAIESSRYVSRETTGIEVLDEYGVWRAVPDYGYAWFPTYVPAGWVPYRFGRWVWIAPWGWTWIDDAPWGFAPFHYGRWALVGGLWCWVPGAYVARPVYAPALVAWFGAPGVSVSVALGSGVGWFPLAPGEIYIPPYPYTRRYVTSINLQHISNINQITVIAPPPRYVHQHPRSATWAPDDAVVRSRPIQRVVRTVEPEDLARLPVSYAPPPALAVRRPAPPGPVSAPRGGPGDDARQMPVRPPKVDAPRPAPGTAGDFTPDARAPRAPGRPPAAQLPAVPHEERLPRAAPVPPPRRDPDAGPAAGAAPRPPKLEDRPRPAAPSSSMPSPSILQPAPVIQPPSRREFDGDGRRAPRVMPPEAPAFGPPRAAPPPTVTAPTDRPPPRIHDEAVRAAPRTAIRAPRQDEPAVRGERRGEARPFGPREN